MEPEGRREAILYLHVGYPLFSGWTLVEILALTLVVMWLGFVLSWWAYIVLPPYLIGKFVGWRTAKAHVQSIQIVVDPEWDTSLEVE